MNHDQAQAFVLDRYPTAKAVYELPEQEWVIRVASIVLAGSHTRAGAWQQAAEDLTVMCSACFGDGPGSSCEPCGGTGRVLSAS